MMKLSVKLKDDLKNALNCADEIWVAVALMNINGCNNIIQSISKQCITNIIVGIDLPTDPTTLKKLSKLKNKGITNVLLANGLSYHPKVYIVRMQNKLKAFIGSANCTDGGLDKNIEMTIEINDQKICKNLIEWFNESLYPISQSITKKFIVDYIPKYEKRVKKRKDDKQDIDNFKKQEEIKIVAEFTKQKQFNSELKKFRNSSEYNKIKKERENILRILKESLDFDNFNFDKMDLKQFCDIKELGTIRYSAINIIKENKKNFLLLMKFICNGSIPLKERIDESLKGKYAIKGLKYAFISKILVIHNPKEYFLYNGATQLSLEYFGLTTPKGLTEGEEYEVIRNELKKKMQEANIDNFAVLDSCLWNIQKKMKTK